MAPHPADASPVTSHDGDEVDNIVDAWRRERSDLDVSPLEVLSRISRIAHRLDRARSAVFTKHGLDGWEFDVMSALRRAGSPYQLSPGALVQHTLVTSGTMTNRVDRLEKRGYVCRRPSPNDRRGVLVQLTDTGLSVVDAAFVDLLGHERSLLADINRPEREALASSLRSLLAAVE